MEQLPEDVVMEIFSYLPLKSVMRCKCLNKGFNELVSDQSFAMKLATNVSRHKPILFHCSSIMPKFFQTIAPRKPSSYVHLDLVTRVLASCNGLLLLHFSTGTSVTIFCVCNPITKQFQLIKLGLEGYKFSDAGLAVDPVRSWSSPRYNVVAVCVKNNEYVFLMFNSEKDSWTRATTTVAADDYNGFAESTKAVYLKGSLHWLRQHGDAVTFHTEKGDSHIIRSPRGFEPGNKLWFGAVQGKITIISCSKFEIVIHTLHDYGAEKWQVRARIGSNHIKHGFPVLFDGEQLIVQSSSTSPEISSYEGNKMQTNKTIGTLPGFMDANQRFEYFSPSLAKVSIVNHIDDDEGEDIEQLDEITHNIHKLSKILACAV